VDPELRRQYESAYGSFRAGDYPISSTVTVPGTSGEVIWSYRSCHGRGFVYVVNSGNGNGLVEVRAAQVVERVTSW